MNNPPPLHLEPGLVPLHTTHVADVAAFFLQRHRYGLRALGAARAAAAAATAAAASTLRGAWFLLLCVLVPIIGPLLLLFILTWVVIGLVYCVFTFRAAGADVLALLRLGHHQAGAAGRRHRRNARAGRVVRSAERAQHRRHTSYASECAALQSRYAQCS
jgi:fatty acid desaturase